MSIIGIDFGNENCYVAGFRSGGVEVLSTDTGQRMIQSYIGFGETVRSFGTIAKSAQVVNIANTIYGFKHLIGRRYSEEFVKNETTYLPYTVCGMKNGFLGVKVKYQGKETKFHIEQLVAMLLSKLKEVAAKDLKERISNCVIAVPSYFSDSARRSMLAAARIAGLNVLSLMNEHTAVALSYGFYKQHRFGKPVVAFVDLGHSCLQVSICEFTEDNIKVLACVCDVEVGGRDFDNAIVRYFVEQFNKKYKFDVLSNNRAIIRLMGECEKLKKQLSANPQSMPLSIECFMDKANVSGSLDRSKMRELCQDLLIKTKRAMHNALEEAKLDYSDLSAVELVGGSSRIPAIKQLVLDVFRCEPSTTLNLDEAVAKGCALQCAMYTPKASIRVLSITDRQPYPVRLLWCETGSETGEIEIFPKNCPIPFSKNVTYFRGEDFVLRAHYGKSSERPCRENFIGSFTICGVRRYRTGESCRVQITVRIDISGILSVHSATVVGPEISQTEAPSQAAENQRDIEKALDALADYSAMNNEVGRGGLIIKADIPSLSGSEIKKFIEIEASMQNDENSEEDRVNAKNALEEFIYEIRNSLDDEYKEYVSQEDRVFIMKRLEDTENWLYDDGQNRHKDIYETTLSDLKEFIKPVISRKEHFKALERAVKTLEEAVQEAVQVLRSHYEGKKGYNQLDPKDVAQLQELIHWDQGFLDELNSVLCAQRHLDSPYNVNKVQEVVEELSNFICHIVIKKTQGNQFGSDSSRQNGSSWPHNK